MADWQRRIASVVYAVENRVDHAIDRVNRTFGWINPVMIVPYRGHGTREMFYLKGRVIEDHGVTSAGATDNAWQNFLNTYKRFASDEVSGVTVRGRFGSVEQTAVSDEEGFFELRFPPDPALMADDQSWYEVILDLVKYPGPQREDTSVTGLVVVPPATAQFSVISDLDDTVIQTGVVNWLQMARNTFLKNAHTRLPFEGVAAFYQALQVGTKATHNPIYYVSSSPWNLYDLMIDFFNVRGIPPGPLFLTDMGLTRDYLLKPSRRKHKLDTISMLLKTHSRLPFVLIGDSGEYDPDIYLQAVRDNPGRIVAIYIRDVSATRRNAYMQEIAEQVKAAGSFMLLVKDTVEAAVHASTHGLILPEALPAINQERKEDQPPPNPITQLLEGAKAEK